jgi:hypothetical protein
MSRLSAAARIAIALGCLSIALPGCRMLKMFTPSDDKPIDPPGPHDNRTAAPNGKPSRYSFRIAPYVFLSDFELDQKLPLFRELAGLRDQVYKELQLPSSDRPVLVHLFETKERYEQYMQARYPELPRRRAFFVAQPRTMGGEDLLVFTYWGDRIQQDLRHELTHALLHSVLKEVPLWLDEGLAEFFELPPETRGVNESHLNHIRRSVVDPFEPNLGRLESLDQVKDMKPGEYREAWAWTHYFLRGNREARPVLLAYLKYLQHVHLREGQKPDALRPRLAQAITAPEQELRRHMFSIEYTPRSTSVQR